MRITPWLRPQRAAPERESRRGARVAAGTSRDLGFGAITAIKAFEGKGTTYVSPLPDPLQNFTAYDAAVMTGAGTLQAATAFLLFLQTPAARRTLDEAGLQ